MMHFAWTFSSQPPQTQNMTSADIFVQLIFKHIPTPSLVSLSALSIIFIGWVFSLEPHLTGEPCDYFLLSIIVAWNYVFACIFCIVWCQQISIWNKQIESSPIYLIKQVGKLFKIWWSEKITILNWGTGEQRGSWSQADGYPLGRTQYFLVCQYSLSPNYGHNLHLMELFWYDK